MRFIERRLLFLLFIHGSGSLLCQSGWSTFPDKSDIQWQISPVGKAEYLLSENPGDAQNAPVVQCFGAKDGEGLELVLTDRPATMIASVVSYNMLKPSDVEINQQFRVSGFDEYGNPVPVRWLEIPHTLVSESNLTVLDPTATPLTFTFSSPVKKVRIVANSTGKALSHSFILQDIKALPSTEDKMPGCDCDRKGIVFLLDASSSMQGGDFAVFREKLILFFEQNRLLANAAGGMEIVPFDGNGIQQSLVFHTCDSLLSFIHSADYQKRFLASGKSTTESLTDYSVAIQYVRTRAPRLAVLITDGYPNAFEGQYVSGAKAIYQTLTLSGDLPLLYFNIRSQITGSLFLTIFKSSERSDKSFEETLKGALLNCGDLKVLKNQPAIEIMPNPSSGNFTVVGNVENEMSAGDLKLLNSEGQIVNCQFDCREGQCYGSAPGLSPGHYYVQYTTEKVNLKAKLVIVH